MGQHGTECKGSDITRLASVQPGVDVDRIYRDGSGRWMRDASDDRDVSACQRIRMPEYEGPRCGPVVHRCPFCSNAMRAVAVEHVERRGPRDLVTHTMRCDGCGAEHPSRSWHPTGVKDQDPATPCRAPVAKRASPP